jgi:predicted ATP-dependent endonuclease of OLD family
MNYKCIEDSGWVDFEEDLTRFVGANEAGKTSFLEAISNYNSKKEVVDENICKYTQNSEDKRNTPISAVDLSSYPLSDSIDVRNMTEKEKNLVHPMFAKRTIVVRFADGSVELRSSFSPRLKWADPSSVDLLTHLTNDEYLKNMYNYINIDVDKYLRRVSTGRDIENVRQFIERNITPLGTEPAQDANNSTNDILLFNELTRSVYEIKYFLSILDIERQKLPEISLDRGFSPISEFWSHSGESPNPPKSTYKILVDLKENKSKSLVSSVEDRGEIEQKLTKTVNSNWPNPARDISLFVNLSKITLKIEFGDSRDVVTIPSEQSEGFRWFLSFCIEILFSDTKEDILLLDDPGSGLHPEANKKVRDALENFAEDTQTAYSTHSPYMLDTSDLDSIRLVQREDSETTEIVDDLSKVETDSPDALAPVRARLGANYADSLFASKQNIIVEGFTDRKYLEAFSEFLGDGEPVLPDQLSITDASGGGNIETLAKMVIAEGYDYVILLDDDRGGRSSKENLLDAGISEENIVMVSDAHDDEESSNDTVEDLLDDDVAIEALAQMHDSFGEDDLRGEIDGREHFPKRVVSRLRELDGTEELDDPPTEIERLAKGGMAEYITRKIETEQWDESELGGETVERFESLLSEVVAVLESNGE